MKIILIYDVTEKKCSKIKKICNQYLNWVQNSVFEGELSNAKILELQNKLSIIIDKEADSIIIYSINNPKWMGKEIIGINKNDFNQFI